MHNYFCGWYFKCQSETQTLAVIPARHGGRESIQLITDDGAWSFSEKLGGSVFRKNGFRFDLASGGAEASGEIRFGALTPLRYDIMGPFKYVPFMECRHSVLSMRHRVDGTVRINGKVYDFNNALGYIEGDRGRSFPDEYIWTQSFFDGGSLMLSIAEIPFAGFGFTGVICAILWRGREYRLATYLGARAERIGCSEVAVRQGEYAFHAELLQEKPRPLNAPICGEMERIIHESASCRARYRFEKNGRTLFEFETERASFEFEYGGRE